jgi:hypothetical protein
VQGFCIREHTVKVKNDRTIERHEMIIVGKPYARRQRRESEDTEEQFGGKSFPGNSCVRMITSRVQKLRFLIS